MVRVNIQHKTGPERWQLVTFLLRPPWYCQFYPQVHLVVFNNKILLPRYRTQSWPELEACLVSVPQEWPELKACLGVA